MPEIFRAKGSSRWLRGRRVVLGITIGMLLFSGCALNQDLVQLPTLIPDEQLPTVIALTSEALASQSAVTGLTSTAILAPTSTDEIPTTTTGPSPIASPTSTAPERSAPSITPTKTLTPTTSNTPTSTQTPPPDNTITPLPPDEIPFAVVQIVRPSSLSKVVSPIELYAFVAPGGDGRVRVELTGEDGRLLYRQVFLYPGSPAGARINLNANVNFEIVGVSETARLTVSVNDEYERLKALSSVDLVLLDAGQADLYPTGDLLEDIFIQQPTIKSLVQGNSVLVSGLARTADDQPLLVELVAADGTIIGSRLAGITLLQEDGGHRLFAAEVPFSVSSPTWIRITISDRSGRLPGLKHVSSVEVLLSP